MRHKLLFAALAAALTLLAAPAARAQGTATMENLTSLPPNLSSEQDTKDYAATNAQLINAVFGADYSATKPYSVIMHANPDNNNVDGRAVTCQPGNPNEGTYEHQYTDLPGQTFHGQAFCFEQVDADNSIGHFIMSYTNHEGGTNYICTAKTGYGSSKPVQNLRATTDRTKALVIRIEKSGDYVFFHNTEASDAIIGGRGIGFYTSDIYKNLTIQPAATVSVPVEIAAGGYATRIFPFAPAAIAGVEYYTCAGVGTDNGVLTLDRVTQPQANTPYILHATGAAVSTTLTGYATARDNTYTAQMLTGVYTATAAPAGSYVLQTRDGEQAFYPVEANTTVQALQAYLTVPGGRSDDAPIRLSSDDIIDAQETQTDATGLLINPSFENDFTSDGKGWIFTRDSKDNYYTYKRQANNAGVYGMTKLIGSSDGNYLLLAYSNHNVDEEVNHTISQTITSLAAGTYIVKADMAVRSYASNCHAVLASSATTENTYVEHVRNGEAFQTYSLQFTVTQAQDVTISFRFTLNGNRYADHYSTMVIDKVRLYRVWSAEEILQANDQFVRDVFGEDYSATKPYNVIMNTETDRHNVNGRAVTCQAGNADEGGYEHKYTDLPGATRRGQAFYFKQVDATPTGGGFIMSYTNHEGGTNYICTAKTGYGSDKPAENLRATTDRAKALVIRMEKSGNYVRFHNTEAGDAIIGGRDQGFYTADTYKDLTIQPAATVSVPVEIAAGAYTTRIFPFAPAAIEGVEYYSCTGVGDDDVLVPTRIDNPQANTPYLLHATGAAINTTLTGYATARDDTYASELLTGVYTPTAVPAGSRVLQTRDGQQAFYPVEANTTVQALQAYLTVPGEHGDDAPIRLSSGDIIITAQEWMGNVTDRLINPSFETNFTSDGKGWILTKDSKDKSYTNSRETSNVGLNSRTTYIRASHGDYLNLSYSKHNVDEEVTHTISQTITSLAAGTYIVKADMAVRSNANNCHAVMASSATTENTYVEHVRSGEAFQTYALRFTVTQAQDVTISFRFTLNGCPSADHHSTMVIDNVRLYKDISQENAQFTRDVFGEGYSDTKPYNVIMHTNNDWHGVDGRAVTCQAGNANEGGYEHKYTDEAGTTHRGQAFYFKQVDASLTGGGFIMSYTNHEGGTNYICTAKKGYGNESACALRATTDRTKALKIRMEKSGDYVHFYNTEYHDYEIGGRDQGFYSFPEYIDFTIEPAATFSVPVEIAAGAYATRIFPFAPAAIEGVEYYSCTGVGDDDVLVLTRIDDPQANTPYILHATGEAVSTTLSGYATARDDSYSSELLTGVYTPTKVPAGSYVLQTQGGGQAFYPVRANAAVTAPAQRAYLTVPGGRSNAAPLRLSGGTTAIDGLPADGAPVLDGPAYDLSGRRVSRPTRGLYIIGGRKVLIK